MIKINKKLTKGAPSKIKSIYNKEFQGTGRDISFFFLC